MDDVVSGFEETSRRNLQGHKSFYEASDPVPIIGKNFMTIKGFRDRAQNRSFSPVGPLETNILKLQAKNCSLGSLVKEIDR